NQTFANYIQPNIGYVGVTASYTFWDWGKRREVKWQRESLIAVAEQNLRVVMDKAQQDARKAYVEFEQAREAHRLAGDMVQACKDAEKGARTLETVKATKTATAKAELELMKAEIAYRVAHAKLAGLLGKE